ncbi:hypothetical protein D3C71_1434850 [compost metagenome]
MGVKQGEVVVFAFLEALLRQFVGAAAGRHRQLLRANLAVERALARQPVGHVAEGFLDGLFVVGDLDAFLHVRHVQVRLQGAATEDGHRDPGQEAPGPRAGSEKPIQ